MELSAALIEELRWEMLGQGVGWDEMAEHLGLTRRQLGARLRTDRPTSLTTAELLAMCERLGVKLSRLVRRAEDKLAGLLHSGELEEQS